MSALARSQPGASKGLKSARTPPQKPDLVRVEGLHANGLLSYAFDAKQLHNKQALREAARVRRDVSRATFQEYFPLGQRVKLRLSEPINAALEFRARGTQRV